MIECKDISFRYSNAIEPTLNKVSFSLHNGGVLAVVGPSGGGKSTLLRVIAGLETPYEGTLSINNKVVFNVNNNVKPENRGIGMLFQDYALFPHMTVKKNIEYGIDHLPKKERKQRLDEVLELVALGGYEKRYPHELSGGQQQRIALARALAPKPKLLLLDEPFSNLDTHLLKKVRDDLFNIIRKTNITTIMVTHNPEDAKAEADKIISIVDGRIDREVMNMKD
ncbi:ABC transporter ATP-binding protein [Vallitalea guaymasensis]|uniref:ATP-binding cassette domain-containing protein n=1 Tax=Vallitalea guaymasensis TaxID=1185412 RepID=A0A8J8MCN3_9FIRM|nr:ATP-binding cassette domain-containing protein [Vallitalea guaymasensis]QUH30584.1 ATP-binding cassette domain-containing protein [Vallitalea guaymasensis]